MMKQYLSIFNNWNVPHERIKKCKKDVNKFIKNITHNKKYKKIYCIKSNKYRKFKNPRISIVPFYLL